MSPSKCSPQRDRTGIASSKQIAVFLLTLLLAGLVAPTAPLASGEDTPERLLATWLTALDEADHEAYAECLHSGSRDVPEYGSREAMRFWADQIGKLRERGFTGRFEIEEATDTGSRLPPGSLIAHPILDGAPIQDSIILIQEAGQLKILRIFS